MSTAKWVSGNAHYNLSTKEQVNANKVFEHLPEEYTMQDIQEVCIKMLPNYAQSKGQRYSTWYVRQNMAVITHTTSNRRHTYKKL